MLLTSETLERVIEELARLPGTGRKSAQRIAMYLLKQDEQQVRKLAQALIDLKTSIKRCSICYNITDEDPCPICKSQKRNNGTICVVEDVRDVYAIEKTSEFHGRYHVLGGVISPLENIGPNDIRVKELVTRIQSNDEGIQEIILALNPDAEGEATAYYIHKLLNSFDVKITRIAHGIPMGTELEYIDEATLTRAFNGRSAF